MSGSITRSYFVAASIGAVEALKDQGFARWNHTIRSVNQHIKNNIRRHSAAKAAASSSPANEVREKVGRITRSEDDKVRKVMEIDCWGPSTTRF